MAWNEPGGGNQDEKDPWGNRDDQGPPDLDEAFRKLQNNLSGMFRGKGSGAGSSGGGSMPKISLGLVFLGGLVLVIIYLGMGVYTVNERERGVVLRFGEAQEAIILPGLHWNPPLVDQVLIENVTQVRSRPHDSEMLTEDENIVKVKMTVQYVIGDVKAYKLQVLDPDQSLYQAMEAAIRHVVGSTEMHEVLTEGRAALGSPAARARPRRAPSGSSPGSSCVPRRSRAAAARAGRSSPAPEPDRSRTAAGSCRRPDRRCRETS